MKIHIKKYNYQTIEGKVKRTEIKQNWLCQLLINIILFFFKRLAVTPSPSTNLPEKVPS